MIDELYKSDRPQIIIIDNLDHLKIPNYNSPLGLLKNRRLSKHIKDRHINIKFENLKVIATATDMNKINKEILDLFLTIRIPPFSDFEFRRKH